MVIVKIYWRITVGTPNFQNGQCMPVLARAAPIKIGGVLTVVSGTRPSLKNEKASDLGHFKMKMSNIRRKK